MRSMKIGIRRNSEEGSYQKLKSFGFDYLDFSMANTNIEPYVSGEKDFYRYLCNEKRLADKAEVNIWQVHGPWRSPVLDGTVEERAERFEKMERSIRGAAVLGAKYWVVHPIMPFGVCDVLTDKAA